MNQTKCNLVTYIYLITSRQQLTFRFRFKKLRVRIVNKISSFPPYINNEMTGNKFFQNALSL